MKETITIKYFGAIAEETGVTEEVMELASIENNLQSLKAHCVTKYRGLTDFSFQLAVNQSIQTDSLLKAGDEIAFLPPFAGG